jgi:hypothetical protein
MRVIILFSLIVLFSCKKEDVVLVNEPTEPIEDCNCNRVVKVNSFNLLAEGKCPNSNTIFHVSYTTVNDCTKLNKHTTINVCYESEIPTVGSCK